MAQWIWEFEQHVDAPPRVVIENYLDEEHLLVLHDKYIHYFRQLERGPLSALVEVGTRMAGFFIVKHVEWVQLVPPRTLIFRSKILANTMTVRVVTNVTQAENGSLLRTHYTFDVAWFWRPFKSLLLARMKKWKDKVWKEDESLLLRRAKVLRLGFKDGAPMVSTISLKGVVLEGDIPHG